MKNCWTCKQKFHCDVVTLNLMLRHGQPLLESTYCDFMTSNTSMSEHESPSLGHHLR